MSNVYDISDNKCILCGAMDDGGGHLCAVPVVKDEEPPGGSDDVAVWKRRAEVAELEVARLTRIYEDVKEEQNPAKRQQLIVARYRARPSADGKYYPPILNCLRDVILPMHDKQTVVTLRNPELKAAYDKWAAENDQPKYTLNMVHFMTAVLPTCTRMYTNLVLSLQFDRDAVQAFFDGPSPFTRADEEARMTENHRMRNLFSLAKYVGGVWVHQNVSFTNVNADVIHERYIRWCIDNHVSSPMLQRGMIVELKKMLPTSFIHTNSNTAHRVAKFSFDCEKAKIDLNLSD